MRTEYIKVKITMPIPYDKPDGNGTIHTKEAVENAVNRLHKNHPIIYRSNNIEMDGRIIGTTTEDSHIATWDFKNQVCKVTIDGVVFYCYGGIDYIVNEIKDGKVTDFEIIGIGLSK